MICGRLWGQGKIARLALCLAHCDEWPDRASSVISFSVWNRVSSRLFNFASIKKLMLRIDCLLRRCVGDSP